MLQPPSLRQFLPERLLLARRSSLVTRLLAFPFGPNISLTEAMFCTPSEASSSATAAEASPPGQQSEQNSPQLAPANQTGREELPSFSRASTAKHLVRDGRTGESLHRGSSLTSVCTPMGLGALRDGVLRCQRGVPVGQASPVALSSPALGNRASSTVPLGNKATQGASMMVGAPLQIVS